MSRLSGKVAVITGGASGIGAATVRKFVAEGARVVIADMQDEAGNELVDALGADACFVSTDVCVEAEVKRAIDIAVDQFGRLDCIFNNAGFGGVSGDIDSLDMGEPYQRTVDAMLKGVVMGMKHAAAVMKPQQSGVILSTASVAGIEGSHGPHVYSAIKAAVINLSRSVAEELGPFNIRVNAICPGGIATPIFAGAMAADRSRDFGEAVAPVLSMVQPIPRAGRPEDIANAACFLASDEASFVTGHAMVVDGGLTAGRWRHPDTAPGMLDVLAQQFGVADLKEMDGVYYARDSQKNWHNT